MKALVITENEAAARELCGGARALVDEVVYLTFGEPVAGIADKCIKVTVPEDQVKEAALDTMHAVAKREDPQIVLFEPTRRLKSMVGRIAAREDSSVITDVVEFCDSAAKSMYFGGVGLRMAKALTAISFCSVSQGAFGDVEPCGTNEVEEVDFVASDTTVECVSREALPPAEVDLTAAKRIVAAGRGFAKEEELDLARTLCKEIGAELGCTRPLTESETWFPREAYIGVSGLMLSPDVYVGIGVSGQMQHMVGVDRARVSFAINKDSNAPIFQKVDFGLVGEIADVLPKINAKLA